MQSTTQAATIAAEWFESAERRPDGHRFIRLKHGTPDWIYNAVKAAHVGMLPDDRIYQLCRDAFEFIQDNSDVESDELAHEFADGAVDVYTDDRVQWLVSHPVRVQVCDDAEAEYGYPGRAAGGIAQMIGLGQYAEARDVFAVIFAACEEQAA